MTPDLHQISIHHHQDSNVLAPFSLMATSFIATELSEHCLFNSTVQVGFMTVLLEGQANCLNPYEWEQRTEMVKNFF